jgi:hypothetical protein
MVSGSRRFHTPNRLGREAAFGAFLSAAGRLVILTYLISQVVDGKLVFGVRDSAIPGG